jgi:hypothetical protein
MVPFQGKTPVDQQELENIIKDAIVKNLKNFTGGAAVAGVAAVAGEAAAEVAEEESSGGVPDSFGFGSSGSDGDGFGF